MPQTRDLVPGSREVGPEAGRHGWMRAWGLALATSALAVAAITASWMAMITPAPPGGVLGPALVVGADGNLTTPAPTPATDGRAPTDLGDAWTDVATGTPTGTGTGTPSPRTTGTPPQTVSPTRVRTLDRDGDSASHQGSASHEDDESERASRTASSDDD